MKRGLLARLRTNGVYYLLGALLLLVGIPLYQQVVLAPTGYQSTLVSGLFTPYLTWISQHTLPFIIYRVLLMLAFALLISFPFSLFRIIVAQEIMGQQDREDQEIMGQQDREDQERLEEAEEEDESAEEDEGLTDEEEEGAMPPYAWRGKGFAIIAAWSGLIGLIVYTLATLVATLYLAITSHSFAPGIVPPGFVTLFSIFSLLTNTAGIALLALSTLFFGATIARSGRNLWPNVWVAFGYAALAVAALLSGSAVAVASAPTAGQAALTTPAILLFALWQLWLGFMLVRLKPEA
jgi:hypothetical protein